MMMNTGMGVGVRKALAVGIVTMTVSLLYGCVDANEQAKNQTVADSSAVIMYGTVGDMAWIQNPHYYSFVICTDQTPRQMMVIRVHDSGVPVVKTGLHARFEFNRDPEDPKYVKNLRVTAVLGWEVNAVEHTTLEELQRFSEAQLVEAARTKGH